MAEQVRIQEELIGKMDLDYTKRLFIKYQKLLKQ